MKTLIIILLLSSSLSAQIYVDGIKIDSVKYIFVEMYIKNRYTLAYVDYGSKKPYQKALLTDSIGDRLLFKSPADVFNYLYSKGYAYSANDGNRKNLFIRKVY